MIYVIDGVDASGKTTLAKCMAEKLDCTYIHHTFNTQWSQRELFEHHLDFLMSYNRDQHLVIDRSWASCVIYGRVFRGNGNEIAVHLVERLLNTLGCTNIFALPERIKWEALFHKMCEEREEMYVDDFDKLVEVYDGYFHLCCGNQAGCVTGDYGHDIANNGGMFVTRNNCYAYDMYNQDMKAFADERIKDLSR
jgi:thymidylate kinase